MVFGNVVESAVKAFKDKMLKKLQGVDLNKNKVPDIQEIEKELEQLQSCATELAKELSPEDVDLMLNALNSLIGGKYSQSTLDKIKQTAHSLIKILLKSEQVVEALAKDGLVG